MDPKPLVDPTPCPHRPSSFIELPWHIYRMNPLGLDPRRFTVACCTRIDATAAPDRSAGSPPATAGMARATDAVAGIVQVVPLSSSGAGGGAVKLQSLVVSPEHR
ncbi:hypothetical protein Vafri_14793 [Volvox africanus]|nr:hypothetical protein Vafri_14793 [Volvox africanus]